MTLLMTSSYTKHRAEDGVAIATSIGQPKWPLPYSLDHEIRDLMPFGLFGRDLPWNEFEAGYRARLDGIGVERLRRQFDAIAARHPGQPLVLLCWEKSREPCHRSVFGAWWREQTGQDVHEVESPTGRTPEPAQNPNTEPSGQVRQGEEDR